MTEDTKITIAVCAMSAVLILGIVRGCQMSEDNALAKKKLDTEVAKTAIKAGLEQKKDAYEVLWVKPKPCGDKP